MKPFDLTPDPKVLIALTHTPIKPLDALCELLDNSIDSFYHAKLEGFLVEHPLIVVALPKKSEILRGSGCILVRDNGSGLDEAQAEKALKAGFSTNNPYDTLGLFGMGFNIATGKLGRRTRFVTLKKGASQAIEVVLDLEEICKKRSFAVEPRNICPPDGMDHGTLTQVGEWWPNGSPNSNFAAKLVGYGAKTIREEIGRRYATILREKKVRIVIDGEECLPFEHCRWDESRFVERQTIGKVPAVINFDKVVATQKRCSACHALITPGMEVCPECGGTGFRNIEERITGWVGIQRFEDQVQFGVDLIRNGRAIRTWEKEAFFTFVDDFNNVIKDYPVDSIYGRIIGEVRMNHVPVDFLKKDFQRSSPEWQHAMEFLRGKTSLQPGKIPVGEQNDSPIYKLFQGYRRVRTFGRGDMYMGRWDENSGKPKRIEREIEREYYAKFLERQPGYFDDTEWWKLVEEADSPPLEEMKDCPNCKAQNLKDAETCSVCGYVLTPKLCLNPECKKQIPQSALACPYCGMPQVVVTEEPWVCKICSYKNEGSASICSQCHHPKGALPPTSKEALMEQSHMSDPLSLQGCTVRLAGGTDTTPIDVNTYLVESKMQDYGSPMVAPLISFKGQEIDVFIDLKHPIFSIYGVSPQQMIAGEVATYLFTRHSALNTERHRAEHSVSSIAWKILEAGWQEDFEDASDKLKTSIQSFFNSLTERLPAIAEEVAKEYFEDLGKEEQASWVQKLIKRGASVDVIEKLRDTGEYLKYAEYEDILKLFDRFPHVFFDGAFWKKSYQVTASFAKPLQIYYKNLYQSCLEDLVRFLELKSPEAALVKRAEASLEFLLLEIS